jgi:uncharacterized protein (TIRG00374 family)
MATTNNTIGFLVNIATLGILALSQDNLFSGVNVSLPRSSSVVGIVIVALIVITLLAFSRIRTAVGRFLKSFGATMVSLTRTPHKLAYMCIGSTGVMLSNALVLFFAARSVGLDIAYPQAIVAMSFGVAVGSLLPTPGGVGGVEAGLIATLVLLGFDAPTATAAALLYRLATYIQPFIPGVITYFYLRKKRLL